jgi:hypothetical protein
MDARHAILQVINGYNPPEGSEVLEIPTMKERQ